MAERLTPGVYVEEVGGNVRPIQGVGTSTAGFIGEAPRGIPDRAEFLSGFRDYERKFGGHRRGPAGYLAQAVEAFFAAGGRRAYVVRVLPGSATAGVSAVVRARAADPWGVTRDVLRLRAQGNGAWSDSLRVHVEPATSSAPSAFRIRVEWTEGGRSRTVETFDDLSMDPESEAYAVRTIAEGSQYLRATDLLAAGYDDPPTGPPVPERAPTLNTRDGGHSVPVDAVLSFSWRDGSTGLVNGPAQVAFSQAALTAISVTPSGGRATLTPANLASIINTQFAGKPFSAAVVGSAVRVRPAVAERAYLVLALDDGDSDFEFAASATVDIVVSGVTAGSGTQTYNVPTGNFTPVQLAGAINTAVAADTEGNPRALHATAIGRCVLLSTPASTTGVTITAGVSTGTAPWPTPVFAGGTPGTVVDSLRTVEISVAEVLQPGVGRALSELFAAVKATGLTEDDREHPDLRPAPTGTVPLRLLGGSDGTGEVGTSAYVGEVTDAGRTGMHAFDTAEINLLAMPGKNTPDLLSAAMAYCDHEGVFLLADGVGAPDEDFVISADEVRQQVEGLPARSDNAAMFYPWIEVPDPVGIGRNPRRLVPPSGHVAGIFARTDSTRGVWKAPAGIEAGLSGAIDVQHRLVQADQDLLNPIGLNCIRQFPDVGIVSWGTRTLSPDPQWRYVPVRRTALFLKESLRRGLQWAVFEPNDAELWDRIRITIGAFMLGLFRQHAFQGSTPDEAFVVKCDRETNPQELVDAGIVTAQVAFAPLKPAEFVVIEISQKSLLAV